MDGVKFQLQRSEYVAAFSDRGFITRARHRIARLLRKGGFETRPCACSARPVAAVRANQLPRGVSAATACLPVTVTVTMPSRARSATVTPKMGRSPACAAGDFHTPMHLCKHSGRNPLH